MDNREIFLSEYVDTSDATATAGDILKGKTAVARGSEIIGTIRPVSGGLYTPGTSSLVVGQRGQYVTSNIEVSGDANLLPDNIKKGKTILGVKGTMESSDTTQVGKLPDGVFGINLKSEPDGAAKNFGQKVASYGMKIGITAEPSEWYYNFKEWKENGNKVSDSSTLTFDVNGNKNLTAKFDVLLHYTVSVSVGENGGGSVNGGGSYHPDESVTVTATEYKFYDFVGWEEDGKIISNEISYTFNATKDRNLIARFHYALDGYTLVEYIESTGTQYIDTGIIASDSSSVEIDILPTSENTWLFGTYSYSSYSKKNLYFSAKIESSGTVGFYWSSTVKSINKELKNNRSLISLYIKSHATGIRDYTEVNYRINEITSTAKISLSSSLTGSLEDFPTICILSLPGKVLPTSGKLYSCKITRFWWTDLYTEQRDYIPCINPSGEVGLFDTVEKKFYGNSGTGKFIPGPRIEQEVPNV